jgi:hypothetical protein
MPKTTPPESLAGNDEIVFRIEWDPDRISATLDHLLYNGALIDDEPDYDEPGVLTVTFHRSAFPVHRFQWSMLFPGKKLQNLAASAKVNDVGNDLSSADSAENRWADEGDWEPDETGAPKRPAP